MEAPPGATTRRWRASFRRSRSCLDAERVISLGHGSLPRRLLHRRGREGKLPLNLAAPEAIVELRSAERHESALAKNDRAESRWRHLRVRRPAGGEPASVAVGHVWTPNV